MGKQFIEPEEKGKRLLLHSCCGPCSTACIEALKSFYKISVYFYNPNITDREEYEKRKNTQIRFLSLYAPEIEFIEGDYDTNSFFAVAKDYAHEKEGGQRCKECISLRLEKTFRYALENGYDLFGTTLSVSPHKDCVFINTIGKGLCCGYPIDFLEADFKKNGGFVRSVQLSKSFGLYRQNYCGCIYSKIDFKEEQK